jgi:predicted NAD/FAD-binding protein
MRIAVVGAGIAGLGAARELAPHAEVHLFEASRWAGGHARTVEVEERGRRFAVDLGFIVYNERNYPLFSRLLAELGVATAPSPMGFSVADPASGIEYSGETVPALFAAPGNVVRPAFWSMLRDLPRFRRAGMAALTGSDPGTIREFCERERLGEPFRRLLLRPLAGAIWSMPRSDVDGFPAATLLRFFHQHGLLSWSDRPVWRTVPGGSRRYVEALLESLDADVHLGAAVQRIERREGGVELRIAGQRVRFDAVVLACHSDAALALLADADRSELEVLAAIRYRSQDVVLHCDESLLPRHRRARASWNVTLDGDGSEPIAVTYLMNRLQPLPTSTPWCVTLNRGATIDPGRIVERVTFAHPQFDAAAVAAQDRWPEISGRRATHFAGAYWRYGFHEDGLWSGVRAARRLLAETRGREAA